MKRLLIVAAVLEAVTGVALMIEPAGVARLLLGHNVSGVGVLVGRVAGCALVSLGLACWPARDSANRAKPPVRAMLTYNLFITCYLVFIGVGGQFVGILLWPAVALHGLLLLLLACEWLLVPLKQSDATNQSAP